MKKKKLSANLKNKNGSLPPSPHDNCASPVSNCTKDIGVNSVAPAKNDKVEVAAAKRRAVSELFVKLYDQKHPSADDLRRLREQIVATPECWKLFMAAVDSNHETIIKRLYGTEALRSVVLAEMDILKQQMGYDNEPVLKRMHIDHVLTARLRLRDAEIQLTHCMSGESIDTASVKFREGILESAQRRFHRASESLEKIRRLARNTPALQINIANAGGKQVNVQGD